MLCKRVIPCLDIKDGRIVKGVNFTGLTDAGDPVEMGRFYAENAADELVFLDICATVEKRSTLVDLVRAIAENIRIPFTVGGGITCEKDVERLLENGADKVSLNSAAVNDPRLITRLSRRFGSQCIVVAIDTKVVDGDNKVFIRGGRKMTGKHTREWAIEAEKRGAGEVLLTSMDRDGTGTGFDIDITFAVSGSLGIPVIASGGGGRKEDFLEVFEKGRADAVLAAGVFHFGREDIVSLKEYLFENGIPVRRMNERQ